MQEDLLQLREKLLAGNNDGNNMDLASLEQAIAKTEQGLQVSVIKKNLSGRKGVRYSLMFIFYLDVRFNVLTKFNMLLSLCPSG